MIDENYIKHLEQVKKDYMSFLQENNIELKQEIINNIQEIDLLKVINSELPHSELLNFDITWFN